MWSGGNGPRAQMVNAVMPQAVDSAKMRPVAANAAARPRVRSAMLRKATQKKPAATQQAWVLMTAWSDSDLHPRWC